MKESSGMRMYLVSVTKLAEGMDEFLKDRRLQWVKSRASEAEHTVEAAGRVCYMSFGASQYRRSNVEYISNLIQQGHESVLEHANFTILIDGLSRALTHQLVRHRVGFAYSQLSQQYHDESDAEFVNPILPNLDPHVRKRWTAFMRQARLLYRELVVDRVPQAESDDVSRRERLRMRRSAARLVLPNATATVLMVTGNARSWRHFLQVRGGITGDPEMREYCVKLFKKLSASAPNLFADFKVSRDSLGEFVALKARRKVKAISRRKI